MDLEGEIGKKLFLLGNRKITPTEEEQLLQKWAAESQMPCASLPEQGIKNSYAKLQTQRLKSRRYLLF